MILKRISTTALLCLSLAACTNMQWPLPPVKPSNELNLKQGAYDQLPGWSKDAQGQAIVALQRSCTVIVKKKSDDALGVGDFAGTAGAWQPICQDLTAALPMTDDQARVFFENHFTPYEMLGANGPEGFYTGYYEPTLHGSYHKKAGYTVPIYGRPDDLVNVDLGEFKPALKGEHITGRVDEDKNLIPYYDRKEIDTGAIDKQHKEIVWVDSAVDAFFMQIQGSGQVVMDDGSTLRIVYDAQNGQPYIAIGKALVARGALDKDNVSMQSIREWLSENPGEAADVMEEDPSFVFFRKLTAPQDGPTGAEGVPLTPRRSMAVDHKIVPYGVPIWLDAQDPDGEHNIQRLMVAQDTGGAITGPVRGDFFWGPGEEAAHKAGLMKSKGHAWVLLPKTLSTATTVATPAPATTTVSAPAVAKPSGTPSAGPSGVPSTPPAQNDSAAQIKDRFQAWYNHIVTVIHPATTP